VTVSVIIPAFNAEKTIGATLQSIRDSYPVSQLIVVDDGSKDRTASLARKQGAQVIVHKINQGKGAALNTAAAYVQGDLVVLLDADLGASAARFFLLLPPILNGEADVTVAKFPPSPVPGGFGLVKKLAVSGIAHLTGISPACPLSGQRAMKREVFQSILPFARGFGVEVAATVDVYRKGWRLREIEIDLSHNYSGRNLAGFMHRGRQFVDICWVLMQKSRGE